MARVAFIQEELRCRFGVMTLSSYLGREGHEREVFIDSVSPDLLDEVVAYRPDIVAFSTMTAGVGFAKEKIRQFKQRLPDAITVMGGPHATFFPNVIEEIDGLDAICRGEGGGAIIDLADGADKKKPLTEIANLWVRDQGQIRKNDVRRIVDVDEVPMDREIYFKKFPSLADVPTKQIMVGKGCPFDCSYCFNHSHKKIYKGKGKFTQYRSIDSIISEILEVNEKYGMKWLQIITDTVNLDRKWFMEFLHRYKEEVKIPFICNVRIDRVDEEMVALLKEAGCDRVNYGVEHGNEKIRKEVLHRDMTNEQIIAGGKLFTKYGIRVQTANIIGVPHETPETVMESIRLNRVLKPKIAQCFALQLYPGTQIYEYSREHHLIPDGFDFSKCGTGFQMTFSGHSGDMALNPEYRKQFLRLFYLFDFLVQNPWADCLTGLLVKLPLNRLYKAIYVYPVIAQSVKYAGSRADKWSAIRKFIGIILKG